MFVGSLFILDYVWVIDVNIPKLGMRSISNGSDMLLDMDTLANVSPIECELPSIATLKDGVLICADPDEIGKLDCVSPDGTIITEWEEISFYNATCQKEEFSCVDGVFIYNGLNTEKNISFDEYRYISCPSNASGVTCVYPNNIDNVNIIIPNGQIILLYESPIVSKDSDCRYEIGICADGIIKSKAGYGYASCKHTNVYSIPYIQENATNILENTPSGLNIKSIYLSDTYTWSVACKRDNKAVPNGASVYAYKSEAVGLGESCEYELKVCRDGKFDTPNKGYTFTTCKISTTWQDCNLSGLVIKHGTSRDLYSAYDSVAKGCDNGPVVCWDGELVSKDNRWRFADCDSKNIVTQDTDNKKDKQDSLTQEDTNTGDKQVDNKNTNCPNPYVGSSAPWSAGKRWIWYASSTVPAWESCDYDKNGLPRKFDISCQYGTIQPIWNKKWYASCKQSSPTIPNGCTTPWWTTIANDQSVEAFYMESVPFGDFCQKQTRTCKDGVLGWSFQYQSCFVRQWTTCTSPRGEVVNSNNYIIAYKNSTVAYGDSCKSESRYCVDGLLEGSYSYRTCTVDSPDDCLNTAYGNIPHWWGVTRHTTSQPCESYSLVCNNGQLQWALLWHQDATQPWSCPQ